MSVNSLSIKRQFDKPQRDMTMEPNESIKIYTLQEKQRQKKIDDDVMSKNCDVIAIFPFCGQFGAIWKPDSGCIVCKTYILINSNLYLTKTENRTKESLTQLSQYCFLIACTP